MKPVHTNTPFYAIAKMWYSDTGLGTPQDPEQAQRVRPPNGHQSDCVGLVTTDPIRELPCPKSKAQNAP